LAILSLGLGYVGGFFIAYPIILIAILSTATRIFRRRPLWIAGDWAARAFVLALVLLLIAFLLTNDLIHVLNFVMLALFAPLSVGFYEFADRKNSLRVATLANVGCIVAFPIAVYQVYVLAMPRAAAFGSDPIWSAQAGIILAFLALLGFQVATRWWKLLFAIGPALMIAVAFLSGSRGPMLAIPVLFVVFLAASTRHWLASLLGALALAVTGFLLLGWFWPSGFARLETIETILLDLITTGQIGEGSGGERQIMYQAGIKAFLHQPWFGYGWEQRMPAIGPFLPENYEYITTVHHHLHSDALDFAVSGGLFGIFSYILILVAPILGAISSPRDGQYRFRISATAGISLGYFIFGVSYLTFGYEYHTTLYVVLSAIVVGGCRDRKPFEESPRFLS